MSPRFPIQPAQRQSRTLLPQLAAFLSSTSRKSALRTMPSPAASVLNLDSPAGPRAGPEIDRMAGLLRSTSEERAQRRADVRQRTLDQLRANAEAQAYGRMMPRRWLPGDVYAPHDLSAEQAKRWRRPSPPKMDVMDALGINPLDEYRNFSMLSEFMTPLGRIKRCTDTGLRPVNQRKMAKAIRRAIGLGIHPSVHRHPEILKAELADLSQPRRRSSY